MAEEHKLIGRILEAAHDTRDSLCEAGIIDQGRMQECNTILHEVIEVEITLRSSISREQSEALQELVTQAQEYHMGY